MNFLNNISISQIFFNRFPSYRMPTSTVKTFVLKTCILPARNLEFCIWQNTQKEWWTKTLNKSKPNLHWSWITLDPAFGSKPEKHFFKLIFHNFFIKILQTYSKSKEKGDFDQCFKCKAPKCWSKYTTFLIYSYSKNKMILSDDHICKLFMTGNTFLKLGHYFFKFEQVCET